MSELADALARFGQGYQSDALTSDGEIYDSTNILARMPRPNALAEALRVAMSRLPENTDLPKPAFPLDPRSMSLTNMLRGGLDTAANWFEGRPEIGKDTLAPLGASIFGSMGLNAGDLYT